MDNNFKTPSKKVRSFKDTFHIPASPFLKKIGFGTGVAVYELQRSPIFNKVQSPWAIKKLIQRNKKNNELNERLFDEAEVLRKLNHRNIIGFRAFVKDADGRNILAMEECNDCLGDMIEQRNDNGLPPYESDKIEKVAKDIASALDYLHNTFLILHCDIKSYNILLKGDFSICKLCDFGVCLPLKPNGEIDRNKAGEEAEFTGTAAWCAPEILDYPQVITTKADIYAYGLVIWEMISLMPPVDEDIIGSLDESENSVEVSSTRQRPPLPEINLGDDYNFVLELYFCCTHEKAKKRPSAADLIEIFNQKEIVFKTK